MIEIRPLTNSDISRIDQLTTLFCQVSPSLGKLSAEHFLTLLHDPRITVLFALDGELIIGSATLVHYPIPTGYRAWIEDVIVDKSYRGQKIGARLVLNTIKIAKKIGIHQIDLTSRPEREEANKLYLNLGFKRRETNAYRLLIT